MATGEEPRPGAQTQEAREVGDQRTASLAFQFVHTGQVEGALSAVVRGAR